jgi:hypothetical protein
MARQASSRFDLGKKLEQSFLFAYIIINIGVTEMPGRRTNSSAACLQPAAKAFLAHLPATIPRGIRSPESL